MKRAVLLATWLVWLTACPRPDDDGPEQTQSCSAAAAIPTGDAKMFVGEAGATPFKLLSKGSVLTRQHGPQGGTHVYLDVLFFAPASTAGSWTVRPKFAGANGAVERDSVAVRACAGWNHVQNFRFVVDAIGEGILEVGVGPNTSTMPDATTSPLEVTIR